MVVCLGLVSCGGGGSSTLTPPPVTPIDTSTPTPTDCPAATGTIMSGETEYRLTFINEWTAARFPTNFPSGDHFTNLVGGVHDDSNSFWESGETASTGIENVAEIGSSSVFQNEVNAAQPTTYVSGGTNIVFRVSQFCPLITLASMLAPSHDWFVGVHDFDLRDGTGVFVNKEMNLVLYDAGSEDGEDFALGGTSDTSPRGVITVVTTAETATDFLNGVHRNDLNLFVGKFEFRIIQTATTSQLRLTASPTSVAADGGVSTLTLTRASIESADEAVVDLRFRGDAIRDTDYRVSAMRMVIPAGETQSMMTMTATMGAPIAATINGLRDARSRFIHITPAQLVSDSSNGISSVEITINATNTSAMNAEINRAILPQVARALTDQGMQVIAQRMVPAAAEKARLTIRGQSSVVETAATHGQAIMQGRATLKDLIRGSEFVLPLQNSANAGWLNQVTFWGGGDSKELDDDGDAVQWDGDLFSTHVGADVRLRDDWLAGLAVYQSHGDFDYEVGNVRGTHELKISGVRPYLGWTRPDKQLNLWAIAGYGEGEIQITADSSANAGGKHSGDVALKSIGAGGGSEVWQGDSAKLRIKGDIAQTKMVVDRSAQISSQTVDVRRVRLALEATRTHVLASGARLFPQVEFGLRHDAGDGRTTSGAELSGGLKYIGSRVTFAGKARVLMGYDDYDEWGVSALLHFVPGADGNGLSFTIQPAYGDTASDVRTIWNYHPNAAAHAYGARMQVALGYGVSTAGGLLTPYTELTAGEVTRRHRVGLKWQRNEVLDLHLFGEQPYDADAHENGHAYEKEVSLEGRVSF